jgi:hypothetical protein
MKENLASNKPVRLGGAGAWVATLDEMASLDEWTAVRLSDETYQRLQVLSEQTGRTVTYYIREAIEIHLDDLEDIYLAE